MAKTDRIECKYLDGGDLILLLGLLVENIATGRIVLVLLRGERLCVCEEIKTVFLVSSTDLFLPFCWGNMKKKLTIIGSGSLILFRVGLSATSVAKVAAAPCRRSRISGTARHRETPVIRIVSSFPISRTTSSVTTLYT